MKIRWIWPAVILGLFVQFPSTAQAFECPKHFASAQAAIDRVIENTKDMADKMKPEDLALVRAHIANAQMTLEEAKAHHERAAGGPHHHARAIMRAHAAMGHALAADALHRSMMR